MNLRGKGGLRRPVAVTQFHYIVTFPALLSSLEATEISIYTGDNASIRATDSRQAALFQPGSIPASSVHSSNAASR